MAHTVSRIVADETLSRIIQIESAGKPRAKAATSSATGLFQFIAETWMAVVKKHRPDLLKGRTRMQVLALRTDPKIAIELGARFTEDNAKALGRVYLDGDLYLAHFAGVGVARKLLRAPASAPASQYFSSAAIAANRSILSGKTVGEVRAWAERKMAAAGKVNWIAKYWTSPPLEPEPAPPESDEPEPPVVIPPPPDIEKPGDEDEEEKPAKKKGWFRRVSEWFTGGGFVSLLAYLTDWRVILALTFACAIGFLIFWFVVRPKIEARKRRREEDEE